MLLSMAPLQLCCFFISEHRIFDLGLLIKFLAGEKREKWECRDTLRLGSVISIYEVNWAKEFPVVRTIPHT